MLADRPSEHSLKHADEIARRYFYNIAYEKVGEGARATTKRKLAITDLQLMSGPSLEPHDQQGMQFLEVALNSADCFAGVPVLLCKS